MATLTGRKRDLGSGLLPFPGFPCRGSITVYRVALPGTHEVSPVPDASLPPCQALGPRPARGNLAPRKPKIAVCLLRSLPGFPAVPPDLDHPFRYRFLGVSFRNVNHVATGMDAFHEAAIASGCCVTPLAYRLLGLRFAALVHESGRFNPAMIAPPAAQDSIRVGG